MTGEGAILANRDGEPAALSRLRVVLVRTTHPGNIGGAARAMKTMGLTRLVLVAPRHFPDPQADAMATGADDLLARAEVCATLDEALAGTELAIALTARRRELSPHAVDARARGSRRCGRARRARRGRVRVRHRDVRPRERRGAQMPASRAHRDQPGVLLAQSRRGGAGHGVRVQEAAALGPAVVANDRFDAASFEEIEGFYAHLERNLVGSGFLDPASPRRLMERLRRLFGRGRLEKEEVNILRGILSSWDNEGGR